MKIPLLGLLLLGATSLHAQEPADALTANISLGDFLLAPVPASDVVTVRPEHPDVHLFVLCYDVHGRNVFSTDTQGALAIDVSTWPEGPYMVTTTNGRGTVLGVHRLIVDH